MSILGIDIGLSGRTWAGKTGPKEQPLEKYYHSTAVVNGKTYYKNKTGKYFQPYLRNGLRRFRYFIRTECSSCGAVCMSNESNAKRAKRTFCSRSCNASANRGAGNARFTGGRLYKRGRSGGHILIYCPNHPNARKGYVPEHRLVVERSIGRLLKREEFVHHIDCDPQSNSLENLVVLSCFTHNKAHASIERCVATLMRLGVLSFNRDTNSYEVNP
jgi:hypothetical protein